MKPIVVLSKESDAVCFRNYANQRMLDIVWLPISSKDQIRVSNGDISVVSEKLRDDGINPRAVISFQDDCQEITDRLKAHLGMPHRSFDVVRSLTDKSLLKQRPEFAPFITKHICFDFRVPREEICEQVGFGLRYPVVVKPSNAYYSAGVRRCEDRDELHSALAEVRKVCRMMHLRRGDSEIIVEEFIQGSEFAIDGFVVGDRILPLVVHEKWPPLNGPTFHELAYFSSSASRPEFGDLREFCVDMIRRSSLVNSPFHLEVRKLGKQMTLLEIAPRMSGSGASSYALSDICTGVDAFDILLSIAEGTELSGDYAPDTGKVGIEYDFSSEKSGRLRGIEETEVYCRTLGATHLYKYKADGELIESESSSLTSCLTAFFSRGSRQQALGLFDEIQARRPSLV